MKLIIGLLIVACFIASCYSTNSTSQFVATEEWQEIPEGEAIPAGLHVRINLQTGKKEAKLMEKETNSSQASLSTVPGASLQDHGANSGNVASNIDQLKEALQRIPGNDFKFDEDALKKVKAKYKSYDQIKQELKEANLEVKSDGDIMVSLMERFEEIRKAKDMADASVKTELAVIFEDLQYLVHQIDNAIAFIDANGIEKIIWPCLNHTESALKIHGLILLGTVVQNNPKAKVALFERNGGGVILTTLSQLSKSDELSAGLYAFGSLVRKFPYAQTELLNPHGYSLLFEILNKNIDLRVKVKIPKLIADLVQDYDYALTGADATTRERYESTNLKESLEKVEYCRKVSDFFQQNRPGLLQDDYLVDEMVNALGNIRAGLCQDVWSGCAMFRHTLLVLRNNLDTRLRDLAGEKETADYLRETQRLIDQFVVELYGDSAPKKDEL